MVWSVCGCDDSVRLELQLRVSERGPGTSTSPSTCSRWRHASCSFRPLVRRISLGAWLVVSVFGCTSEQFFQGLGDSILTSDTCAEDCWDDKDGCMAHAKAAIAVEACDDSAQQCLYACE
jgi:hypothetical protein